MKISYEVAIKSIEQILDSIGTAQSICREISRLELNCLACPYGVTDPGICRFVTDKYMQKRLKIGLEDMKKYEKKEVEI